MAALAQLTPASFYGRRLPRPWLRADGSCAADMAPVNDALLAWAREAPWSMGGLSRKRKRLAGKIEGKLEKLKKEVLRQFPKGGGKRGPEAENVGEVAGKATQQSEVESEYEEETGSSDEESDDEGGDEEREEDDDGEPSTPESAGVLSGPTSTDSPSSSSEVSEPVISPPLRRKRRQPDDDDIERSDFQMGRKSISREDLFLTTPSTGQAESSSSREVTPRSLESEVPVGRPATARFSSLPKDSAMVTPEAVGRKSGSTPRGGKPFVELPQNTCRAPPRQRKSRAAARYSTSQERNVRGSSRSNAAEGGRGISALSRKLYEWGESENVQDEMEEENFTQRRTRSDRREEGERKHVGKVLFASGFPRGVKRTMSLKE